MALGRQFENTYWHDDQGETHASFLNPHNNTEGKHKYEIGRREGIAARAHAKTVGAQGMLFSPETGTGMRNDPLIPHEKRIEAIQKGLGMSDPEVYRKDAGVSRTRELSGKPMNRKTAEDARGAYTTAVDTSQMSTHMINEEFVKKPLLAVAVDNVRHAGHIQHAYNYGGTALEGFPKGSVDVIRQPLNYETYYDREPSTTRTVMQGGEHTPVNNPKFVEQVVKEVGENNSNYKLQEPVKGAIKAGAVVTTPEGHQWTQRNKPNQFTYDPFKHGDIVNRIPKAPNMIGGNQQVNAKNITLDHLSEDGYQINAFPGTGSDIKKKTPNVDVTKFPGTSSYSSNSGRYTEKAWHTRSAVTGGTPVEETIRGKSIITKVNPSVSRSTAIHEMGHHMDDQHRFDRFDRSGADPVSEGVADAHRDLWGNEDTGTGAGYSHRMYETGDVGNIHANSGYSTRHRGWKTDTDKAVYSAVRAHASAVADPKVFRETPTRSQLVKQYIGVGETPTTKEDANKLLLGHLYDTHQHVRNAIETSPYENVREAGRSSRQFYQDRMEASKPKSHQPQLPGFEV